MLISGWTDLRGEGHSSSGSRSRYYVLEIAILLACVNAALLVVNRHDFRSIPLISAGIVYQATAKGDSWEPMLQAYNHIRAHPDTPVYSELFFRQHVKFQYPVSSLLILAPFEAAGLDRKATYRILGILSKLSLAILLGACAVLAVSLLGGGHGDGRAPAASTLWPAAVATVIMTASFYPVYRAYYLGQVQLWIDALLVMGFLCYRSGHPRSTGVLLGLSALIKPQYALFLIWAALRRKWGAFTAFLAVIALGSGISIIMFGWKNFTQYFSVLTYLSLHGESFFPNQSVNGLLNRLLNTGPTLVWQANAFPDFHPVVYAMTVASSVVMVAFSLILPLTWRAGGSLLDFSIILLTCTMASPIAWEHHYGVLVPILILLFSRLDRFRPAERVLLGMSFIAISAEHYWTNRFAVGWSCIVQSYLFFGALCVMLLLYRVASRLEDEFAPDF